MSARAKRLHEIVDEQIAGLIDLTSTLDEAALRRPCPGREKLGDGTVGASVRHTADNYQRIAGFVQSDGSHRAEHDPRGARHSDGHTEDTVDPVAVVEQLSASRATLSAIAGLTDPQLARVPPDGSFRFCDGRRTLEQVIAGLLKHQAHQLEALSTAIV